MPRPLIRAFQHLEIHRLFDERGKKVVRLRLTMVNKPFNTSSFNELPETRCAAESYSRELVDNFPTFLKRSAEDECRVASAAFQRENRFPEKNALLDCPSCLNSRYERLREREREDFAWDAVGEFVVAAAITDRSTEIQLAKMKEKKKEREGGGNVLVFG